MSETTERFTGRVEVYERYRLRYPMEVVRILVERCGLERGDLVADVGAGTGMLAQVFLENGNAVIAVEPNDEMRAVSERLATVWPGLIVKKATAEATGLEDASVDLIAVGRAFHWFDLEKVRVEFERILRPGGRVALMSNSRVRDDSPISVAYEALLRENGTDYAANRDRYEIVARVDGFFAGGEIFREESYGEQKLTLEEFVGQTQSYSVTPAPGHEKFEGMQHALRDFFAKWQIAGLVTMKTVCKVTGGRFGLASNS